MLYLLAGMFGGVFALALTGTLLPLFSPPESWEFTIITAGGILSAALGVAFIARVTR